MVTATYYGVISGYKFGTPTRLSVPRVMQAIHINISSTLLISYHKYVKWLDKVEIGIHPPQPSPHPDS